MNNIFKGLITAVITPFKNNQLDLIALGKILEYQIEHNVDGVVIAGTTGEGSSLSQDEYKILLQSAIAIVQKRMPIIAGCCSSNTSVALDIALICQEVEVDGLMCTIPPYVKPTAEGIYQHIKTIHDAIGLPIMIYNTQSRTGVNIADENILRLADLPRVMALKDTGTDIERPLRLHPLLKQIKQNFNLLTGDDPMALAYNAHGGVGCVSVAGNIVPELCKNLQICCERNDFATALTIHRQLFPLYQALFAETNPIPVKYAASHLGLCTEELRLPLVAASAETRKSIVRAMSAII